MCLLCSLFYFCSGMEIVVATIGDLCVADNTCGPVLVQF